MPYIKPVPTILQWFEAVKDEKLRTELLIHYNEEHKNFNNYETSRKRLCDAIDYGINWSENGKFDYWSMIHKMAMEGKIEVVKIVA